MPLKVPKKLIAFVIRYLFGGQAQLDHNHVLEYAVGKGKDPEEHKESLFDLSGRLILLQQMKGTLSLQ